MAIFRISLGWIVDADVEPARRALLRDAEHRQRADQQRHAHDIERHGEAHQLLRRHLRHDEHDARRRAACCAPWSTKRVPWSKPAEYIVTRPATASRATASDEQAVEAGEHRPGALPERGAVEDGAHRGLRASDGGGRGVAPEAIRAAGDAVDGAPVNGTASIAARRADRRRRLAQPRRGDVGLARVLAGEHVVEDAAGDRRRRAGAEAGVLDHQRERDPRLLRAARRRCRGRGRDAARRAGRRCTSRWP